MEIKHFTVKTAEAIQRAEQMASEMQHLHCDAEHLLLACFAQKEGMIPLILRRLNLDGQKFVVRLEKILKEKPRREKPPTVSSDATDPTGEKKYRVEPSASFISLLQEAEALRGEQQDSFLSVEHIFRIAIRKDCAGIRDAGLSEEECHKAILALTGGKKVEQSNPEASLDALNRYGHNLNELAQKGKLDSVIGRDEEIRRIMQILSRRNKNNPVLIGEPGVGKTAIIEGLAGKIIAGEVPDNLREKEIYMIDLGAMVAGAKFRGEFEERFKSVLNEVSDSQGRIIIFIDEIHTLVGAGGEEGHLDASNMIKPALARGDLHCIGATTLKEYQKYIEKDAAFERRLQPIHVKEPSPDEATLILRGIKNRYELHHGIRITDKALVAAVKLSNRYIRDRFLPDKAIDLLDEACSKVRIELDSLPDELDQISKQIQSFKVEREALKMESGAESKERIQKINVRIDNLDQDFQERRAVWENEKSGVEKLKVIREQIEQLKQQEKKYERIGDLNRVAEIRYGQLTVLDQEKNALEETIRSSQKQYLREEITEEDIAIILSRAIGVPVSRMMQNEKERVLHLADHLKKRVVAQEDALDAISAAIQRSRSGLGDPTKPIGTFLFLGPTGVGKTETAKALAEFLFGGGIDAAGNGNMIRIDMTEYMEKHAVSKLIGSPPGYIGHEEGGQLTESVRRYPYSVVLLDEVEKAHPDVYHLFLQILDEGYLTDSKGRKVDFRNTIIILTSNLGSEKKEENDHSLSGNQSETVFAERIRKKMKEFFRPELLNRMDEILIFHSLSQKTLEKITEIQLEELFARAKEQGVHVFVAQEKEKNRIIKHILKNAWDPEYGARPIKRYIHGSIATILSRSMLANPSDNGQNMGLELSLKGNEIQVRPRST